MVDEPVIANEPRTTPGAAIEARPTRVSHISAHATIAAIAMLAFAVRLAWIAYSDFSPTLSDDAGRYDLLGRSLAHAAGYVNPNGTTTLFWPPGYPFILAAVYRLFDDSLRAALVLNALFAAGTVVLIYAIARRAFDARSGLIAAALYALLPSAVFFAGVTLSETAFTFVALLGVWLIIEAGARRNAPLLIAAGFVIGYAALIRGQAALIPIVAAPFWFWTEQEQPRTSEISDSKSEHGVAARVLASARRHWRAGMQIVLVGSAAAAIIAPWTIRNYIEARSPVLISTNAGVDFYIGHSAGADGRGRIVNELVFRYPDLPQPRAEAKFSNDGFREGLSYAVHHPGREISLTAHKLFWLYYSDHEAVRWIDGHGERHVLDAGMYRALSRLSDAYYWALMLLALAGITRWLSFSRDQAGAVRVLLLSLVAYWTIVHVAFFADPRFHAPIMPIICMWAAVGIVEIVAWKKPLMRRMGGKT